MEDGKKIMFNGEGDQEPGLEPGDIVVHLEEKDHPIFKRDKTDLHMKMQITLSECLCGFKKVIKTLDNRQLVIQSMAGNRNSVSPMSYLTRGRWCFVGDVIKPGDVKCILNEGMPMYRNPLEKGRLVLHFDVKFPERNELRPESISLLEKLLPVRKQVTIPTTAEKCDLTEFDPRKSQRSQRQEMHDEDDPHAQGGPTQVNCASH
jgi:DnaJ homolog subfamily A member 1